MAQRDNKTDIRDVEPQIFQNEYPEKMIPQVEKIDYSGAHEKTDPKEIALVRKLDRWMMPMLW
ncbi:major facilitator superfamily transporter, partial [Fusarium tjaetaba]